MVRIIRANQQEASQPSPQVAQNVQPNIPAPRIQPTTQTPSTQNNESWPTSIGRNVISAGVKAAEAIPNIVGGVLNFMGENDPEGQREFETLPQEQQLAAKEAAKKYAPGTMMQNLGEKVGEKVGLPKDYLKPRSTFEKALHSTASNLPFVTLFGAAPLGQKIAKDLLQSVVGETLEKSGAGTRTKLAANLLTGYGFEKAAGPIKKLFGKIDKPEKLYDLAKEAEKKYYDKSLELSKSIKVPTKSLKNKLHGMYNEISDDISFEKQSTKKDLLEKIKEISKDITGQTYSPEILEKRNRQLNALYPKVWDKQSSEYLKRIQKIILNEGERVGEKHPDWFKNWSSARDIGKAINFGPDIKKVFQHVPYIGKAVTNPMVRGILGVGATGLAGLSNNIVAGGAALAGYDAYNKGRMLTGFIKYPSTHELLKKASINLADRNMPALTKTLSNLNKSADKFQEKYMQEHKPKELSSKVRIIKAN